MARRKYRVWRFQRSTMDGDIVTAMTSDRQYVVHLPITSVWEMNFAGAFTFYAEADVVGSAKEPRVRIFRYATKEEWK
jgi:hypothetical protein